MFGERVARSGSNTAYQGGETGVVELHLEKVNPLKRVWLKIESVKIQEKRSPLIYIYKRPSIDRTPARPIPDHPKGKSIIYEHLPMTEKFLHPQTGRLRSI